jgi:outer membrane protein OmpA-like peptidoglycan-associated protein
VDQGQSPFISGSSIEVRFDGCQNLTTESWIGLYKAGFKTTSDFVSFRELNGNSGSLVFSAPKAPGDYEFVLIEKDYQAADEPPLRFTVIKVSEDMITLKTDRNAYKPAQDVEVELTLRTTLSDQAWLGIFSATAPHDDPTSSLAFEYIQSGRDKSYRLRAPEKPGNYEIRVFDDSYGNEITYIPFQVTRFSSKNLSLTTDKKHYDPQQTIKLQVIADSDFPRDAWVGMFANDKKSDENDTDGYLYFHYLEKRAEVELQFMAPAKKGSYQFKMVSSYNGDVVATTAFSITRSMDSAFLKQELDKSDRVALYGIYFDLDKSEIKAPSLPTLSAVGNLLTQHPNLSLVIEGHTDNQGEADYNRRLSTRRAQAVREHLINVYAVSPDRLTTAGYGEDRPVENNSTEAGRSLNRRVEIVKANSTH